jgi:apolipoprotein N-acyltransferase
MGLFYLLTIISAVISFISFAPFKFEWLIFIGIIPLFFVLDKLKTKTKQLNKFIKFKHYFYVSIIYGTIYMGLTNVWTFQLIEFSSLLEIIILFFTYTIFQTLFYVLIICLFGMCNSPLILFPCYWIIFEYIKALGSFGSPNGILGYCLSNNYLAEYANYGGVYLVSLIILIINYIIYIFIKNGFSMSNFRKQVIILITLITILIAPKLINIQPTSINKSINIGLIQVNHPISYKYIASNRRNIRNDYISLSKKAISTSDLDLIIWPETITASENLKFPLFMSQVHYLSNLNDTGFIFGTPRQSQNMYFNSAVLVYKNLTLFYDKNHLMPFGEYWPGKSIFKLLQLDNFIPGAEFSKGTTKNVFNFKSIKLGIGICLETTMGFFYRDYTQKNVDILISLVNNAWFKSSSIAARQLQMVQLRAIETGLPILQSSNMGFTCIIEPDGSIINTLPQFEQNFLTHSLDLKSINTIYKKVGDLIILISLILILINLAIKRYYLKS